MNAIEPVIRASGLGKKLGSTPPVLQELSFQVDPGTIFGLLGLNGAGKTTAIRLLLGLLRPDAGRSTVFGEDSLHLSRKCRQRIGYLSEEKFPYESLPFPDLVRYVSLFFVKIRLTAAEIFAAAAAMAMAGLLGLINRLRRLDELRLREEVPQA
ncbi:MAG: ATP-binding cassette domain-containing protein [Planctomycetes bacterium]|nr:ATP-binding cassette domain-containing protein [Planctomycetota bacterium]